MLTRSSRDWCNHTPKQLPLLRPRLQLTVNLIDYRLSETERQVITFNMSWIIVPRKLASNRKFFNFTMLHTAWAFSCYFFQELVLTQYWNWDMIIQRQKLHNFSHTKKMSNNSFICRCCTKIVMSIQQDKCEFYWPYRFFPDFVNASPHEKLLNPQASTRMQYSHNLS